MPQHLLVAHDLSPQADIALHRAALLQQRLGCRLSVLHVLHDSDEQQARRQLENRLQACDIADASLHLRHGAAADGILCMLEALEADLLLLGSHHSRHANGFAAGTLEQLLQACPALLVCVRNTSGDWGSALSLLDFSPCASRALQLVHRLLVPAAGIAALNVLERAQIHASEDPADLEFQRSLFDNLLAGEQARLGVGSQRLSGDWQVGELHHCLQHALQNYQPELLALGEHHRGLLADSLAGSLTIELLQAPPCDLLITR